jgi:RNA polymerase sigma factor (sigma-70 family)
MSAVEAVEPSNTQPAGTAPEVILHGLYERHWDRIFGFCLRRLRTRQEAEDAVQNTFLNAFRALQRGVVPLCEKAWLFKIAENVCLAAHRSNGRRRAHELAHDPELVNGMPAREGDLETSHELELALAALPESQRQALLLREWRGLSYREIALQLGTSVAAVETLIFRARRGVVRALSTESGVRGRVAGIFNTGSLLGALKSAFGGAGVAKIAAAGAVVTIAVLPAGDSAQGSSRTASAPVPVPAEVGGADAAPAGSPRPAASNAPAVASRPATPGRSVSERTAAPGAGPAKRTAVPDDGQGVAGPPEAPSPGGGAATPPTLPVTPPGPPRTPVVEPPALPAVEVPQLPAIPQVPQVPELPKLHELPKLPVELPGLEEPLPDLPQLP